MITAKKTKLCLDFRMSENESGEVQIRFVSTDYPALAKESISVPLSCTSAQLKALVEGLVESKLGMRFIFRIWVHTHKCDKF